MYLGPLYEGAVSEADWGSVLQIKPHSLRPAFGGPTPSKREASIYTSTRRPVLLERKMESISLTIIAPSLMWM